MTIDEMIKDIKIYLLPFNPRKSLYGAISIMHKYQSIVRIVNAPTGGTSARYNAIVNLIKYNEIEDAKIDDTLIEKQDKISKRDRIYRLLASCIGMYYKGNVFYEREELVDFLEKVLTIEGVEDGDDA